MNLKQRRIKRARDIVRKIETEIRGTATEARRIAIRLRILDGKRKRIFGRLAKAQARLLEARWSL